MKSNLFNLYKVSDSLDFTLSSLVVRLGSLRIDLAQSKGIRSGDLILLAAV